MAGRETGTGNASFPNVSIRKDSCHKKINPPDLSIYVAHPIYVTGTTGIDERGSVVGTDDGYAQAVQAIRNIEQALKQAGATLENVVRTRMFVTNIARWQEYGRAHREFFGDIRPCATMVEVRALIDPEMLIEIEVEAEL
jgi:enamine deaminase RidA (YjgF/YER057c/UK114 family)